MLLKKQRILLGFVLSLCLFAFGQTGSAFTRNGTVYTTDGSFSDTQSACYAASNGCTVVIPSGNFTWGSTNQRLFITEPVILTGQGTNLTTITLPYNSHDYYGNGVITPETNCTIENLYITATNSPATPITPSGNGWRITHCLIDAIGGNNFVAVNNGYGLIDNCDFNGYGGSDEMIFVYGPTTSWQTADSMGTTNAVVIENCLFAGQGYVCDFNANSRGVVRFNTITGQIKIDGHGFASNTPARGVRQMEIYGNVWTEGFGNWATIELRGGTGMIFGNYATNNINNTWWKMDEYGCMAQWPNFSNTFQTPSNYPISDQIGVGEDPKAAASDPVYTWNNTNNGSLMAGSNSWTWDAVAAGTMATYTNETGNPNATFTMQSIIASDRDYFINPVNPFNGSSGIGVGSKSQMLAITATTTGVGFWVTNEASWNTTLPANTSGQLYTWNGSGWSLKYTPLVYPYPGTASTALNQNLNPPSNLYVIIATNSVATY